MTKDTCANCGKGKLAKTIVQLDRPDSKVEAWKCPECGEAEYDLEVVKKIGAFYRARQQERTLIRLGRSLAVTLLPQLATKYKLKAGEKVYLLEEKKGIVLKPVPA